jgi:hypothetical protein
MDAGLLVVLAVIGFFLLVPLWLAWLSTDSRRWARLERAIGREPSGDPNEQWGVWAGLSAMNLLAGAIRLLDGRTSGRPPWSALIWLLGGLLNAVVAGVLYRRRRRDRHQASSAGAQVQDGPESGRPGAGGGGPRTVG